LTTIFGMLYKVSLQAYHQEYTWPTPLCMEWINSSTRVSMKKILAYCRLVDDVLLVCRSSALQNILATANAFEQGIECKLTDSGTNNIVFLDAEFSLLDDGTITTRLFQKPLNQYHYVPRQSCHHPNVFNSVVHGEIIRICRRCSFDVDRKSLLHYSINGL